MGMSASAEIVFGVDLGERNPFVPWKEEYGGEPDYDAVDYEEKAELYDLIELLPEYDLTDSYEHRKALEDHVPLQLYRYGYYDSTRYYALAIKDSEVAYAYDYGSAKIELDKFVEPFPDDIAEAQKFCEKYNLPEFKDPSWLLLVSYG